MIDVTRYQLIILVLALSGVSGYTLKKCCPLHQHLLSDFRTCVNITEEEVYNITGDRNVTLDGIGRSGFPWWFPQEAEIYSTENWTTLSPNSSFFRGKLLQVAYGENLPCSFQTSLLIQAESFLEDGSIVVYDEIFDVFIVGDTFTYNSTNVDEETDPYANNTYPSISYCVDHVLLPEKKVKDGNTPHIVKLCPCLTRKCVRKCCRVNSLIRTGPSACEAGHNITDEWKPSLLNGTATSKYKTIIGKLSCENGKTPVLLNPSPETEHKFWLLKNNSIRIDKNIDNHVGKVGNTTDLHYKEYCAEVTEYEDGTRASNLLYCDYTVTKDEKEGTLFGVLFLIGALFLLATLVVYAVTPELRSLHGNNLMAHSASLLVAYIAMAAGQLAPKMPFNTCVAVGFIIQFSFLAAFFWLNVMCLDISWTFSGLRPPPGSAKVRDQKKFHYYSVYAWGSTTLISLVTAIMEFTPGIHTLKPNFGKTSCLFKEAAATLVYFYIPMALLLITNLALFLFTAARIIIVKRQTAILHKPGSSAYNKEKQRLILYIKLFLLMGITWVTEIISWAVGGPEYYWYLTDILNLLRAVFIFIIFCCKRQVYHLLQDRATSTFKLKTIQTQGAPKQDKTQVSEKSNNTSTKKHFPKSGTSSSSFASQTQETVLHV